MSRENDRPRFSMTETPVLQAVRGDLFFGETTAAPIQARNLRNTKKKRAEWRQNNDLVAILKEDLAGMESALRGEQQSTKTAYNKLREVRQELAQEKLRFQNVKCALQQDLQTVLSRLQASIDQQNKEQQAHCKALEEHAQSKVSLQQLVEVERKIQREIEERMNLQLQAKESQLQQVLTAQQETNYQYSQAIADLKQKLQESQSQFASLSQELDASKQSLVDKDMLLRKKDDEQQRMERRSAEERLKLQGNADMLQGQVQNANQQMQHYDRQMGILREESESLRKELAKAQEQKRSMVTLLEDELAALKNSNGKMLKEKRILDERLSELQQALAEEEEKSKHLTELKAEDDAVTVDLNERLRKETHLRREAERHKRNIETELNDAKVQIKEKHAQVAELQQQLCTREEELSQALIKFDEEAAVKSEAQKVLREIENQLVELQEDLESEKAARARAEEQKRELNDELEALKKALLYSLDTAAKQHDLRMKRELELAMLKKTLRDNSRTHEMRIASLQQKHIRAMEELSEQVEALTKTKTNLEKVKTDLEAGIEEEKERNKALGDENKKPQLIVQDLEEQLDVGKAASLANDTFATRRSSGEYSTGPESNGETPWSNTTCDISFRTPCPEKIFRISI